MPVLLLDHLIFSVLVVEADRQVVTFIAELHADDPRLCLLGRDKNFQRWQRILLHVRPEVQLINFALKYQHHPVD